MKHTDTRRRRRQPPPNFLPISPPVAEVPQAALAPLGLPKLQHRIPAVPVGTRSSGREGSDGVRCAGAGAPDTHRDRAWNEAHPPPHLSHRQTGSTPLHDGDRPTHPSNLPPPPLGRPPVPLLPRRLSGTLSGGSAGGDVPWGRSLVAHGATINDQRGSRGGPGTAPGCGWPSCTS